jgi:hypothetical protein
MAYELMNVTEKDLAERLAYSEVGSVKHTQIMSEIHRRQLFVQYEAVEAQKRAALAEEKAAAASVIAAEAAVKNAKYMLICVVAATASTAISLIATVVTLWPKK